MQIRSGSASTNNGLPSANETLIRVLCVDDEAPLLHTTKSILELQDSFEIETATSVNEALQKLSEKEFDVVVSDYQMPIKSGLDFLKILRDAHNDIPFILFTGKGREEVAVKALNLGADRYINKVGHPETVYGELAYSIRQKAGKKRVEKEVSVLSSVIEQSSNAILILDSEEKIVYANPTLLQFHGLKFEDVVGISWNNLMEEVTPLNKDIQEIRNTVFSQKVVWSKEVFNTINGKAYWIRVRIFPLIDSNNRVTHLVYSGEDITKQKRSEQTIWDREERLRAIIASSPDAMIVTDIHGKVADCNIETLNLLGISSRREIMDENCYKFIAKENLEKVKVTVPKLLEQGAINNVECKLLAKNGSKIDVEFSANTLRDAFGNSVGAVILARDITERKKIEQDLKESEEIYHKQFEENLDAIVLADPDTGILIDCNRAATRLFGRRKSKLVGKHQTLLHYPHERPNTFTQGFIKLSKSKKEVATESKIRTKSGEIRDVIIKGNTIKLGKKKVVQGIFRDITEYKKTQESLIKERDTLEKVTGNLNTTLVIISKDLRILWTNKYLSNILGDTSGKLCYSALNKLDHICPGCKIKEVIETEKQAVFEMTVNNPEGKKWSGGPELFLEITAIPIKDKKGDVTEVLELALDVTERKMMEKAIQEAEENNKVLIDSANVLIISVDKKGKFRYVNKEWKKLFGYSDEEIEKITIMDTIPKELHKHCIRAIDLVSSGTEVNDVDTVFLTKKGKKIHVKGNLRPIFRNGKVISTVAVFLDITQHEKAENRIQETLDKMEKMNEKLGVVGKFTRHDTRNKLATVVNSTYLAKTQIDNKEAVLKHLDNVDATIYQIEKILEFSRVYEMLGTQEKTNIDIKTMVDEAFMLASQSCEIELVNECENLTVQADSLLRQIFYNLIENSAKHGEKVTEIKVSYTEEKNALKIIYTDNGIGIPENEKEQIFHEGYGKGTGYGLYLIRKICDEYGWTIKEDGKTGTGAQFIINIPK